MVRHNRRAPGKFALMISWLEGRKYLLSFNIRSFFSSYQRLLVVNIKRKSTVCVNRQIYEETFAEIIEIMHA